MSGWPLWLLMALMGVIIHAVGSICSSSALESPAGIKELLKGRASSPQCLHQTNYTPLFSQQSRASAITCVFFRSINLNEASPISVKFTRLNCARERGRNNRGITTWQGTRKRVARHRRCTVKWERSSTCKETCAFVSRHALTAMLPLPHCNSSMSKHPTVAHQKQQQ